LCIEVLLFSTFFQKGGKFTGVVYAVITKSKPKRRRRRYPVVVAADYRHLVIPRVVALFWHGQIIEQSIFSYCKGGLDSCMVKSSVLQVIPLARKIRNYPAIGCLAKSN